jgi:putative ABC transport system permease protein
MFYLNYLRRELTHRMRQTIIIAFGLALGVGLVITVTAVSSGVKDAQGKVVHALYGVGTDLTVTKAPSAPKAGQPAPGMITVGPGGSASGGTVTGNTIENLQNPDLATVSERAVAEVAKVRGVSAVAGGLTLNDFKATLPSGGPGVEATPTSTTFSVDGIDISRSGLGPLSSGKIISGRGFSASDANSDVAVVDSDYATAHGLHVGSTVTIVGQHFSVVGVVAQSDSSNTPQVYIPLARAQALYASSNKAAGDLINTIYVTTATAADVSSVQSAIHGALPWATVSSPGSLAGQVTGSLASTARLARDLGKWLAILVLIAAFVLASLLTLAAVARRVREFGTLKAIGWRSRRIIEQVLGESLVIGILGGAVGIALGYGAAGVITAISPLVPATVGGNPAGSGSSSGGLFFGNHTSGATAAHTVPVHLSAPVPVDIIFVAVVLAIAGGLIAGSFASWRIVRLNPAAALARVA